MALVLPRDLPDGAYAKEARDVRKMELQRRILIGIRINPLKNLQVVCEIAQPDSEPEQENISEIGKLLREMGYEPLLVKKDGGSLEIVVNISTVPYPQDAPPAPKGSFGVSQLGQAFSDSK